MLTVKSKHFRFEAGLKRPLVAFRVLSDFLLLHVFTGPKPLDVMSQLTSYLGRPKMPAKWSLGYHLCRQTDTGLSSDYDRFVALFYRLYRIWRLSEIIDSDLHFFVGIRIFDTDDI